MYTAYIGKRLLQAVNQTQQKTYTTRTFFDEVFFPLFFRDERFLMNVNNSPVDQAYKQKNKTPLSTEVLEACRQTIHKKVANVAPDASFYPGGTAADKLATTSGLVTDLVREVPQEDVYAAWIGSALGIGIEGGFSLLIDADEVLLALYEGWHKYRRQLDQTPNLKPMQMNTWNGQWLNWRLGRDWDPNAAIGWEYDKEGKALVTQSWASLLFSLAYSFKDSDMRYLNAYVYSFGQSNKTLGFVRLHLPQIRYPADLYRRLFTVPPGMHPSSFERLYDTALSFERACEFPEIGLRALKPKDAFNLSKGGEFPKSDKLKPEQRLMLDTYETWIIAMLNNEELIQLAERLAESLQQLAASGERGKQDKRRIIEEKVLKAQNQRNFIDGLTEAIDLDTTQAKLFDSIVNQIATMPVGNVPLFLTLLRFKYKAYANR